MHQFFVVDVGNTCTKWAIADHQKILMEHEFPTSKFTEIKHRKIPRLKLPDHPAGAIVACVVPEALAGIKACLKSMEIPKPLVVSTKLNLGIGIQYPKPNTIGADRLANAVAVSALFGAPSVVVDFGTAVTFDVINSQKEYVGGVIAPGLSAMTHYLHEQTALLPSIELVEPAGVIGKDTIAAMQSGAVIGYRGLVKEILHSIARELHTDLSQLKVIATGGQSQLIASKISEIQHIDPQLTLNGLRILYDRNITSPGESI